MKNPVIRALIIPFLFGACSLFYYWGELVDWASWDALRRDFFFGIHDIHRLLFLIPIIYLSYTARVKGAVIATLISFSIFVPRAFFISPYPDPLLRMVLFTVIAGVLGYLIARLRDEKEKSQVLERAATTELKTLQHIIDGMMVGMIATGADYRIRFMNESMIKTYGNGIGRKCYEHLYDLGIPCQQECRLLMVIEKQQVQKWECSCAGKGAWEVMGTPYQDSDGSLCQMSLFRDISHRVKKNTGQSA